MRDFLDIGFGAFVSVEFSESVLQSVFLNDCLEFGGLYVYLSSASHHDWSY